MKGSGCQPLPDLRLLNFAKTVYLEFNFRGETESGGRPHKFYGCESCIVWDLLTRVPCRTAPVSQKKRKEEKKNKNKIK